jgi:hypothetical protein
MNGPARRLFSRALSADEPSQLQILKGDHMRIIGEIGFHFSAAL